MTLADLLNHWSLRENPFRGEEARRDDVFVRMSAENAGAAAEARAQAAAEIKAVADLLGDPQVSRVAAAAAGVKPIFHSDFEKILGDLRRPASAVVFGEKGSGKTAIRLQIAQRIGEYNRQNPGARVLLVAYDDLNSVLDRLHERLAGKSAAESLRSTRLVDHIDAILASVVPRVVDGILGRPAPSDPKDKTADPISEPLDLGAEKKPQRRLDLAAAANCSSSRLSTTAPRASPAARCDSAAGSASGSRGSTSATSRSSPSAPRSSSPRSSPPSGSAPPGSTSSTPRGASRSSRASTPSPPSSSACGTASRSSASRTRSAASSASSHAATSPSHAPWARSPRPRAR